MSAASELTRAADTLERLAKAIVVENDKDAWYDEGGWGPFTQLPPEDRAYIAAMSPPVALAVAAWLRQHADGVESGNRAFVADGYPTIEPNAQYLALARLVNEGQDGAGKPQGRAESAEQATEVPEGHLGGPEAQRSGGEVLIDFFTGRVLDPETDGPLKRGGPLPIWGFTTEPNDAAWDGVE